MMKFAKTTLMGLASILTLQASIPAQAFLNGQQDDHSVNQTTTVSTSTSTVDRSNNQSINLFMMQAAHGQLGDDQAIMERIQQLQANERKELLVLMYQRLDERKAELKQALTEANKSQTSIRLRDDFAVITAGGVITSIIAAVVTGMYYDGHPSSTPGYSRLPVRFFFGALAATGVALVGSLVAEGFVTVSSDQVSQIQAEIERIQRSIQQVLASLDQRSNTNININMRGN